MSKIYTNTKQFQMAAVEPLSIAKHFNYWLMTKNFLLMAISIVLFWNVSLYFAPKIVSPTKQSNNIAIPITPDTKSSQLPWRLIIPSLDIDAGVQEVSLTKEGNMGVPSNNSDTGWLKHGPEPGRPGNAVLTGHLDGGPNVPAVFYNLHKLKRDDFVYIKDKNTQQRFRVTSIQNYNVAEAPLDKIFGKTTEAQLNIITCSGAWDENKKDYTGRLVVFTKLDS